MNVRGASHTRRRQAAIAVIAALSLFASLIAGSALRSQFSAATLPEPAAWSQSTPNSGHPQSDSAFTMAVHLQQGSSWDASPVNKKPFHSMWMTRDRPDLWTRISAHSLLSVLPVSFAGSGFRFGGVPDGTPAPECHKQEILTLLCVARR
ncbi:hypothetical protein AAHS21_23910 [Mycobacterium sp. 050272]|uniref:hypothetical protein n=1 Tax=Mycobacterium sp. 050272 TaxID=3142488 RepID=UPI0031850C23